MPLEELNAFRTCLQSNKGLKKLCLLGFSFFKQEFPTGITFKLTEVQIDPYDWDIYGNVPEILVNLNTFLKTQRDTLETLKLGRQTNVEVMKTILTMPKLKKLALKVPEFHTEYEYAGLPQNHSVTSLTLSGYKDSNDAYKFCLNAFPAVELLETDRMTNDINVCVSATCKSLKISSPNFHLQLLSLWNTTKS